MAPITDRNGDLHGTLDGRYQARARAPQAGQLDPTYDRGMETITADKVSLGASLSQAAKNAQIAASEARTFEHRLEHGTPFATERLLQSWLRQARDRAARQSVRDERYLPEASDFDRPVSILVGRDGTEVEWTLIDDATGDELWHGSVADPWREIGIAEGMPLMYGIGDADWNMRDLGGANVDDETPAGFLGHEAVHADIVDYLNHGQR